MELTHFLKMYVCIKLQAYKSSIPLGLENIKLCVSRYIHNSGPICERYTNLPTGHKLEGSFWLGGAIGGCGGRE